MSQLLFFSDIPWLFGHPFMKKNVAGLAKHDHVLLFFAPKVLVAVVMHMQVFPAIADLAPVTGTLQGTIPHMFPVCGAQILLVFRSSPPSLFIRGCLINVTI